MATSLESQLIRGAGQAVSKDPYGLVMQAQERAGQKLIKGVEGITKKIGDIKAAELAEEEKLQKEQDDLVKGYDTQWDDIKQQRINDGGLGMNAWSHATDLAEKEKVVHDACPTGQEGNRCRQESRMKLTNMSKKWTGANEKIDAIVTMDDNKDIKASAYGTDSETGRDNLAIRGGLSDENMTSRMKNDNEIAIAKEALENLDNPESWSTEVEMWLYDNKISNLGIGTEAEKELARKKLEQLEKSNDIEVGWYIPDWEGIAGFSDYDDGFISADDDRLNNLQTNVAHGAGNKYVAAVNDVSRPKWEAYKNGDADGKAFDKNNQIRVHEQSIDEDNITSIYYDNLITDAPLRDNLYDHPAVLTVGMEYADIVDHWAFGSSDEKGLELFLEKHDTDGDGIIDEGEFDMNKDMFSQEDYKYVDAMKMFKDDLIDALSDPKHPNYNYKTSEKVAAEWMADNEQMEYNKHMYGDNFYTDYPTDADKTARIKELTTQNPGETDAEYAAKGGIKGIQKGMDMVWDPVAGKSVAKKQDFELNP